MDRFEQQIAEHETSLESLFSACEKLNEIAQVAQESLKDGGLHPTALPYCNIALESYGGVALEDSALMTLPRQQTTGDVVKAAVEGVKKVLQHIFEMIKKMWSWIVDHAKALVSRTAALTVKAKELAEKAKDYSGVVEKVSVIEDSQLVHRLAWGKRGVNYNFEDGLHFYQHAVEEVSGLVVADGAKMAAALLHAFQIVVELKPREEYSIDSSFVIERIPGYHTEVSQHVGEVPIHFHASPLLPGNGQIWIFSVGRRGVRTTGAHALKAIGKTGIVVLDDKKSSEESGTDLKVQTLSDISAACQGVADLSKTIETVLNKSTPSLNRALAVSKTAENFIGMSGSPHAVDMAQALRAINNFASRGHVIVCNRAFSYASAVYQHCLASYNAQVKV